MAEFVVDFKVNLMIQSFGRKSRRIIGDLLNSLKKQSDCVAFLGCFQFTNTGEKIWIYDEDKYVVTSVPFFIV